MKNFSGSYRVRQLEVGDRRHKGLLEDFEGDALTGDKVRGGNIEA